MTVWLRSSVAVLTRVCTTSWARSSSLKTSASRDVYAKRMEDVQCDDGFTCKPNEKCQVLNGVQGCFPDGKAVCSVSGFGLYQSFDGKFFNVEGDCEYRLAETIQNKNKERSFSVLVKQLSSSDTVFTRRVEIQIEQSTITLLPGHIWEVQVMY